MTLSITGQDTARTWDKMARKYAKNKIGDMAGYERSLAGTQDYLDSHHSVLEIGCGTGTTALHHAPHVAHITGTDISSEMVEICNEKVRDEAIDNAEFSVCEVEKLPFADAQFDAVLAYNLIHLAANTEQALAEINRVLPSGGLFISKTPCIGMMNGVMRGFVLPIMQKVFKIRHLQMFTPETLEAAIIRSGFKVEATEYHASKGKDSRPFIVARKI